VLLLLPLLLLEWLPTKLWRVLVLLGCVRTCPYCCWVCSSRCSASVGWCCCC